VRNCYVLPIEDIELRLLSQTDMPAKERTQAANSPLYRAKSNKVVTVSHHVAHAYSAFAACPFDEGVVMVVDGVGSYCADIGEKDQLTESVNPLARESESYYKFSGSKLEALKKVWLNPERGFLSDEFFNMKGLGAMYSRVSSYIFADWNKCGEVMGLAPYGRPAQVSRLVTLQNGALEVPDWTDEFDRPYLADAKEKWDDSPAMQHWQDLAWRIQDDTEEVLIKRAIWLRETTGAKNLCLSGGVALNCVANGRIAREAGYDKVWIQPAAGDDGIAIGCALYGHLAIQKKPRSFVMEHAFLGVPYSDEEADKAADKWLVKREIFDGPGESICVETAKVLADEKIVGWFRGRSEFGPRALGNRSIIADVRKAEMKDILNKRVKHRQAFRPFAPIILAERVNDVFEASGESPFMLVAMQVRPEWRDKVPAIVHVDGTARVQTVRREENERLYQLLKEFEALTGVPVLLNTSFNVKGEPIVETPDDAMECFLTTGIDVLVMHDLLVEKTKWHGVVNPVLNVFADVRSAVRSGMQAA
jgi:carbamoyltransferase